MSRGITLGCRVKTRNGGRGTVIALETSGSGNVVAEVWLDNYVRVPAGPGQHGRSTTPTRSVRSLVTDLQIEEGTP